MDPAALTELLEKWGYSALVLMLGATGVGSPIPEDLLLLAGGYLISAGVFTWKVTLPLAYGGVVISDAMLYGIGRRMRRHAPGGWTRRIFGTTLRRPPPWIERAGPAAVFIARLVPGTRAITFVSAGVHGLAFRQFALYDAVGAALWVPFALKLGAELGEEIGGINSLLSAMARTTVWLALGAVALLVLWRIWRSEESKL